MSQESSQNTITKTNHITKQEYIVTE